MDSEDTYLIERINRKINYAVDLHSTDERPLSVKPIRGFSRNQRTGDLFIQFTSQEDVEAAVVAHALWVPMLNPSLRLKQPSYPVIVHGIPTTFNPDSQEDVKRLREMNEGILDSLDSIKWANRHSIESGKPFSSLIIHLRDPDEANKAIKNWVNFFSTLKVVEKSVRKRGQCMKCQGYGHSTSRCTAEPNCSTCDGRHEPDSPCRAGRSPTCVNCIKNIIHVNQSTNKNFSKADMTETQLAAVAHAATAATCPIRRQNANLNQPRDFFTVTKKNASNHAAR